MAYDKSSKGAGPQDNSDSIKGGPALGRTREFLKETDGPDQHGFAKIPDSGFKNVDVPWQEYNKTGKCGLMAKDKGETKVLKTVKPRQ